MSARRPGPPRLLPVVALAGAACALLAGCPPDPPAPRQEVVARWSDPPVGLTVAPEARPAPTKLGTHTRHAVAFGEAPFRVALEVPAEHLHFSVAARPADGGESEATARIVVEVRDGAGWAPLHAAPVPARGRWVDHEVALPPRAADAPTALRLRAESDDPAVETLLGSLHLTAAEPPDRAGRPNVMLVVIDTLGAAKLSAFDGPEGATPHMDAFLDEGFSFRRAYAQYGNTLVSHASLFSALYPVHHALYPGTPPRALDESLLAHLARAGYRTVAFTEGAFVSANFGFAVGFDAYDDGVQGLAAQMAGGIGRTFSRASRWLERHGGRDRFFLFVHTYEVHMPYLPRDAPGRRLAERLTPDDRRLLPPAVQSRLSLEHNLGSAPMSQRDLERLHALHLGEVNVADRAFGALLEHLRALDLERDTLVVLTSDHGDQFGEHGKVGHSESLHNRVLHVPLGFRLPGVVRAGASARPVELVDVLPSVLDLVGAPVPDGLDGRSLAPLLRGTDAGPASARPAFSEQRSARGECERLGLNTHCRLDRTAVQGERFKLVVSQEPEWTRLYDLEADPLETRDVASAHPEVVGALRERVETYRSTAVEPRGDPAQVIDADTLRRLRELGYADPRPVEGPSDAP